MKTVKIKIKGQEMEFTLDELQKLEDDINDAQGGILNDFGDSDTLEQFAKKRKYAKRLKHWAESESVRDWLNKK